MDCPNNTVDYGVHHAASEAELESNPIYEFIGRFDINYVDTSSYEAYNFVFVDDCQLDHFYFPVGTLAKYQKNVYVSQVDSETGGTDFFVERPHQQQGYDSSLLSKVNPEQIPDISSLESIPLRPNSPPSIRRYVSCESGPSEPLPLVNSLGSRAGVLNPSIPLASDLETKEFLESIFGGQTMCPVTQTEPSPTPTPTASPSSSPMPTPTPSDEAPQCPIEMNSTIKEKSDESVSRIANAISDIPQSVIDELNLFENSQKGFQTQAIGSDLRYSITQLRESLNNLKGARTVQQYIRRSQIVQRSSLDVTRYISSINMSKLALKAGSQTVSYAVGIGEIALIAYELAKLYEDTAYICQDLVSDHYFNSALSALNLWITSVEPVFDKLLDSAECIKNANAQKTASRMQGLRAQLRNITKHISSGLNALRQENFSAAVNGHEKLIQYGVKK